MTNSFSSLQEKEELFKIMVQNMPVMINAFDANRNFIVWNAECEKVTGYNADEIINNPKAMELIYPDGTNYRYVLSKWVDSKKDYRNWEMQMVCKDGNIKTILWSNISNQCPIPGWDKWVVGADVSKTKQTRVELVEKTIYLDSILSSTKDLAIIASDKNYKIKYYNPMAEEIFGYKAENAIGSNVFDIYKELTADSDFVKQAIDEIHNEGEYSSIFQQKKKDGGRFLQIRISDVLDISNKSAGYMLMAHDITERIKGERLLKRHTDDLARSNEELEQFAYVASHDLQEPLRMITSYLQLLEGRYKGNLDKDADDFIEFAVDGANRMQTLIDDILTYSRVGRDMIDFTPVDCNVILEQVIITLQTAIKEKEAVIIYDPLPTVIADELLMNQLFQNLISNAIKFCNNSPQIKISAVQSEDDWVFSVSDNGIGIEPKQFNHVFLMFRRLHTRTEYQGTGIGLPICKKIVERHGGRIRIESEPGKGSKFHFTIPVNRL
ncbi:MAG: PAS domain-containing sensor histidine kinase [Candidatus Anammoxibacter sp.]